MPNPRIEVVEDARFLSHVGPKGHPERPERLIALGEAIEPFSSELVRQSPRSATEEEIRRVHDRRLVDFLASTRSQEAGRIDADTYFNASSYEVALLAAGGTIDLVQRILAGQADSGLAAVRPPGHHAEADRSMGFCLFNNVAVAIRAAQAMGGSPRILLFDWDVHHGNGTQHIFETDPNVLYISTHQFPFYPGTGDFGEQGEDRGRGTTLNIPMPAGCGDEEYIGLMERVIVHAAVGFAPDLILVSCGFDAHRADPLASMELSDHGYRAMAETMRSLADMLCEGRIAYVLEGGYALDGVRGGTEAVLGSLTGSTKSLSDATAAGPRDLEPGSVLKGIIDSVVEVHGRRIANLGSR